ncbi:hypothetical protein CTI12_AA507030 [Artemisia annua]|uniref:Uncharacterized protein n=1 Tax=Artemisia annua TaxID=35608 RepID=A0A2U1LC93_ARTAN|nr:hypothetical protein CTI12_AA507030 [Artemisia annua]
MATSFNPITIICSTLFNQQEVTSTFGNRWIPLFCWSCKTDRLIMKTSDIGKGGTCFAPGGFTEEKAKQLRIKTVEMANFHDIMYHSAIASRLASDVYGRCD